MYTALLPVALGIVICIISIANMKGNISSVHWYHRSRVSEEDIPVFGKLVGAGTLIMGAAIAVMGVLFYIAEQTGQEVYTKIGSAITVVAVVAGLGVSFYAMIKYNKGIF